MKASDISGLILNSIDAVAKKALRESGFLKPYFGRIEGISSQSYQVAVSGSRVDIPFSGSPAYRVNDVIPILVPDGDLGQAILLSQAPGGAPGGAPEGTTDYALLANKPSINGVLLEGDKSAEQLGIHSGADGKAATIAVGKVETGAAGGPASVTNAGSATQAVLDFVIPKGADGRDGTPGRDGQDGAAGKSAYEIAVENGYPGSQQEWLAGLRGEAGPAGSQGPAGRDGLTTSVNHIGQVDGDIALGAADIPVAAIAGMAAQNVQEALAENFQSVVNGKQMLETAIIGKGGTVSKEDVTARFDELKSGIESISAGSGTSEITLAFSKPVNTEAGNTILASLLAPKTGAGGVIGDEIVVGRGYNGKERMVTVEAVNVKTNTRRSLSKVSSPRGIFDTNIVNNELIFAGGYEYLNYVMTFYNAVEAINPATYTYRNLTSLSTKKAYFSSAVVGSEYITGGGDAVKSDGRTGIQYATVEAINTSTNTRRLLVSLSTTRRDLSSTAIEDEAIFVGGTTSGPSTGYYRLYPTVVEAINTKTNTKRNVLDLAYGRRHAKSAVIGNEMILIGGGNEAQEYKAVEAIHIKTNTKRILPELTFGATVSNALTIGNNLYLAGLYDSVSQQRSDTIEIINVASNTKSIVPCLSQKKTGMVGGVAGNKLVFAGGYDGSTYLNTVEAINFNPKSSIQIHPLVFSDGMAQSRNLITDVSISADCVYNDTAYPANTRIELLADKNEFGLQPSEQDHVISGKYIIKDGGYVL